jgi:hypothetical protein
MLAQEAWNVKIISPFHTLKGRLANPQGGIYVPSGVLIITPGLTLTLMIFAPEDMACDISYTPIKPFLPARFSSIISSSEGAPHIDGSIDTSARHESDNFGMDTGVSVVEPGVASSRLEKTNIGPVLGREKPKFLKVDPIASVPSATIFETVAKYGIGNLETVSATLLTWRSFALAFVCFLKVLWERCMTGILTIMRSRNFFPFGKTSSILVRDCIRSFP